MASTRMSKMDIKWPNHLTTVDVPVSQPESHRCVCSSEVLELISAEIISSCDPRLSLNIPETSIYASLAHHKDPGDSLHARDGNFKSLGDEDWLMENLTDGFREMAKSLKVRVHINPKFLPAMTGPTAMPKVSRFVENLLEGVQVDKSDRRELCANLPSEQDTSGARNALQENKKLHNVSEKESSRRIDATEKEGKPIETKDKYNEYSEIESNAFNSRCIKGSSNGKKDCGKKEVMNKVKTEVIRLDGSQIATEADRQDDIKFRNNGKGGESEQLSSGADFSNSSCATETRKETLSRGMASKRLLSSVTKADQVRRQKAFENRETAQVRSSVKLVKQSSQELDANSITGRKDITAPEEISRVKTKPDRDQLHVEDNRKSDGTKDSGFAVQRPDKQKLKAEVLLLEKILAEKKAQQQERENRERKAVEATTRGNQKKCTTVDDHDKTAQQKSVVMEKILQRYSASENPKFTKERDKRPATDVRHKLLESRSVTDEQVRSLPGDCQVKPQMATTCEQQETVLRDNEEGKQQGVKVIKTEKRDSTSDKPENITKDESKKEQERIALQKHLLEKAASPPLYRFGIIKKQKKESLSEKKDLLVAQEFVVEKETVQSRGRTTMGAKKTQKLVTEVEKQKCAALNRNVREMEMSGSSDTVNLDEEQRRRLLDKQILAAAQKSLQETEILDLKIIPAVKERQKEESSSEGKKPVLKNKFPSLSSDCSQSVTAYRVSQEHNRHHQLENIKQNISRNYLKNKAVLDVSTFVGMENSGKDSRKPIYMTQSSCSAVKKQKMALAQFSCLDSGSSSNSDSLQSVPLLSSFVKDTSSGSHLSSTGMRSEMISSCVQGDFVCNLDEVLHDKELGEPKNDEDNDKASVHLPCLSTETQFESQFCDFPCVRNIQLEAIKEWMKQKPLEKLLCGQLKVFPQRVPKLPLDVSNDPLLISCLDKFLKSVTEVLEPSSKPDNRDPDTLQLKMETSVLDGRSTTERLVDSIFEEVRQHLEFLSEESVLPKQEFARHPRSIPVEHKPVLAVSSGKHLKEEVSVPCYAMVANIAAKNHPVEKDGVHFEESDSYEFSNSSLRNIQDIVVRQRQRDKVRQTSERSSSGMVTSGERKIPRIPSAHTDNRLCDSINQKVSHISNNRTDSKVFCFADECPSKKNAMVNIPTEYKTDVLDQSRREVQASVRETTFYWDELCGNKTAIHNRESDLEIGKCQSKRGLDHTEYSGTESVKEGLHQTKGLHQLPKKRKLSHSENEDRYDPIEAFMENAEEFLSEASQKQSIRNLTLIGKRDEPPLIQKLVEIILSEDADAVVAEHPNSADKKVKKSRREKQEYISGKESKCKGKKEKRKKKKKKSEMKEGQGEFKQTRPIDSKVVLEHLQSDQGATEESGCVLTNTDTRSPFRVVNDSCEEKQEESKPVMDFRSLFHVESNSGEGTALESLPLMYCFLDKNTDYTDVMQKLANVIPGTGKFDTKRLLPQTSFIWALALAVFEEDGRGDKNLKSTVSAGGLGQPAADVKQVSMEIDQDKSFMEGTIAEVKEDKDEVLISYIAPAGNGADAVEKMLTQKSPGIRGSNPLMQAFRQVVEAKRHAQEQIKAKSTLPKLSPELAAKRAAPKAAKPLFKPPPKDLLSAAAVSIGKLASLESSSATAGDQAEILAQKALLHFHMEVELMLGKECFESGVHVVEKSAPMPLSFPSQNLHFSPVSTFVMDLYEKYMNSEAEKWDGARGFKDLKPTEASGGLKRKRTNFNSKMQKKSRKQIVRSRNNEENLSNEEFSVSCDDVTMSPQITDADMNNCGDVSKDNIQYPLLDYCFDENTNSLNDEKEPVHVTDNEISFGICTSNPEMSCQTLSVMDSNHQRFLNAKGPRFMQTFRQNQIAKRRFQKESQKTATGGKLLHSKQSLTVGMAKPKPIGMTLEETLAVLSSGGGAATCDTVTTSIPTSVANLSLESSEACSKSELLCSSDSALCVDTLTSCGSSVTQFSCHEINAIPLPPSVIKDPLTTELSIQPEPGFPLTTSSLPVPCASEQDFCSSCPGSSACDQVSDCEVPSSILASGRAKYLLPDPVEPDLAGDASVMSSSQSPYPFPSGPHPQVSPMPNFDWQPHSYPSEPPGVFSSMPLDPHALQPRITSSLAVMTQVFPSGRPYLLETPAEASRPYSCMVGDMSHNYTHPHADLRSRDNIPRQQFPPPSHPQGWRSGRSPGNMMMPPDSIRPQLPHPPLPPGLSAKSSVGSPKKHSLLPRPPTARSASAPHPGCIGLPSPAGIRNRASSDPILTSEENDVTSASGSSGQQMPAICANNVRIYVFNSDKAICKSIQRFLAFIGALTVDLNNVKNLLKHLPDLITKVLVHQSDHDILHYIPNLLFLKENDQVQFFGYQDVMDVKFGNFTQLFPSGGLVVIDNATLLVCKSDLLQVLCENVQLQREKNPWMIMVASNATGLMEDLRNKQKYVEDEVSDARLEENRRLLVNYSTLGVIQQMPDDYLPLSYLDYQISCIALQSKHCNKYRHFIFITDIPRSHRDSYMFLGSGINIMNIGEFLNKFGGKSVKYEPQKELPYNTRLTPEAFADAEMSSAVDTTFA